MLVPEQAARPGCAALTPSRWDRPPPGWSCWPSPRDVGRGGTARTHQNGRQENAEMEKLEVEGKLLLLVGTVGQETHLGKC